MSTQDDGKIYFSRIPPPEEFPAVQTLWVGHPAIARWLVRHPRLAYWLMRLRHPFDGTE